MNEQEQICYNEEVKYTIVGSSKTKYGWFFRLEPVHDFKILSCAESVEDMVWRYMKNGDECYISHSAGVINSIRRVKE